MDTDTKFAVFLMVFILVASSGIRIYKEITASTYFCHKTPVAYGGLNALPSDYGNCTVWSK